jgi:hypothetical protein
MTKKEKLKLFLQKYYLNLINSGGCGAILKFPEFELSGYDYLHYAENEILLTETHNLINCISHFYLAP